ncbi:MAG: ORF6N domain-containing protein [Rhodoferax sp.]
MTDSVDSPKGPTRAANTGADLQPLSIGEIAQRIQLIRGQRVLLDADLAAFYGETTKRFNQQVRRNLARFPSDFMFQLDAQEAAVLRLQFATLKGGRGQHSKYLPLAFTEHGAIMAATLLNSPRATALSVYVVRGFVELRGLLASNQALAGKVQTLERKVSVHERNIAELVDSMASLMAAPAAQRSRPIGFLQPQEDQGKTQPGTKAAAPKAKAPAKRH